ncbi:hypothetical protein BAUCODRAFT_152140 [Baudoinia panamericana UAMH 10762]|uniref:Queuosine 5'-phosphate N-glycosylase/hydrolase n=1 Tax=Baudoinia panamericana (strain UAMH 10762) TaxID=717646 RepID=M2MKA4_BAUPA|nr:uncharacterized protein BAUCODRAFT_152140 [Baudoinia panamericana UAMH 10762]EMC91758.1 hypothetical protein BAUCODRAFT_152140 [Baudoinia panamericana UAMH 10762]
MSDDEADPELLQLLRQSLGIPSNRSDEVSSQTGVLADAEHIYSDAIDVSIDMYGTKSAASNIWKMMQERAYSTEAWSQVELHPKAGEGFSELDTINFIFTMDLLNFSFWSKLSDDQRFQVDYKGRRWTGYNSLLACLHRALDEGIPITTPRYWRSSQASDEAFKHVFRSATSEDIPLLSERIAVLREAADVLHKSFGGPEDVPEMVVEAVLTSCPDLSVNRTHPGQAHRVGGAHGKEATERLEIASEQQHDAFFAADFDYERLSHVSVKADQTTTVVTMPVLDNDIPMQSIADPEEVVVHQSAVEAAALPINQDGAQSDRQSKNAESFSRDQSVLCLIDKADRSAGKLVNLLARHFACFCDETQFHGRKVRFFKRAQIFGADLWAAFNGAGYGEFQDIDTLTMFADYRVPQMLYTLGVLSYSPSLLYHIRDGKQIPPGHSWEVQLRGCSIWAVELIRCEILRLQPQAAVNAVLIDFFLYDLTKERERTEGQLSIPHHRTRSIWY